ncbi:MAG: gamma-glutamylcyclotransferase family protein [Nocardioides sp.]
MPLFVYGSLLFPEVMEVLIGRNPARTAATVEGWRVVALAGEVYPGLVDSPDSTAGGELIHDLTEWEWRILDAFENDIYDLRPIGSRAGGSAAWAYVLAVPPTDPRDWDSQGFMDNDLAAYLQSCARWRDQLI